MAKRRQHRTSDHSGGIDPFYALAAGCIAAAVGIHVYRKSRQSDLVAPASVHGLGGRGEGMGSFGSSFKKAVGRAKTVARKVSKIDPSMVVARKVVGVALKSPAAKGINKLVGKTPLGPLTARVSVGGSSLMKMPSPKPGQKVEYQDENGNVITRAEYVRRQRAYDQAAACNNKAGYLWNGSKCTRVMTSAPSPSSGGSSSGGSSSGGASGGSSWLQQAASLAPAAQQVAQSIGVPQNAIDAASAYLPQSGGGGSVLPPAEETQPVETPVDASQPADKPSMLMTIAAFASVPVVMALTGKK